MEDQTLLQPFIAKPATDNSGSGILLLLFSMIVIGAISLWANYETTKGFSITIINEAKDSLSGRRFALFFESDDTAMRVILDTSFFVESYLYESVPHRLRKRVRHVTVRFSGNSSDGVITSDASHGEYVIRLSSSLVEGSDFRNEVELELRRHIVRIWLWGDESGASPELVAGMVEYLALKRYHFVEDKECEFVSIVKFLDYCERRSEGFIRRLNHGLRFRWDDRTVVLASNGACCL